MELGRPYQLGTLSCHDSYCCSTVTAHPVICRDSDADQTSCSRVQLWPSYLVSVSRLDPWASQGVAAIAFAPLTDAWQS